MRKFPFRASYPVSSSFNMSGLCLTLRRWISIGDCFLPPQSGYMVGQCIWSKAPSGCERFKVSHCPLSENATRWMHAQTYPVPTTDTALVWKLREKRFAVQPRNFVGLRKNGSSRLASPHTCLEQAVRWSTCMGGVWGVSSLPPLSDSLSVSNQVDA